MNVINIKDCGGVNDGVTDNTPALNLALERSTELDIPVIYFPGGMSAKRWRFASRPTAPQKKVLIRSDGPTLCSLVKDYVSHPTEPFIDLTSGASLRDLAVIAAAGATGGRAVSVTPSAAIGFATLDNLYISYEPGGGWGETLYLDGTTVPAGVRDMNLGKIWAFGNVVLRGCTNLNASGLYCGNLTLYKCADVSIVAEAISGTLSIAETWYFNIIAAYKSGAISIDSLSSQGCISAPSQDMGTVYNASLTVSVNGFGRMREFNNPNPPGQNAVLRLRYLASTAPGTSGDIDLTNENGMTLGRIRSVMESGTRAGWVLQTYDNGVLRDALTISADGVVRCRQLVQTG